MKKLVQWAKENNLSYHAAYQKYQRGQIPDAFKSDLGQILVGPKDIGSNVSSSFNNISNIPLGGEPMGAMYEEKGSLTRKNKAAFIKPTDRFKHIDEGIVPFEGGMGANYGNSSDVSIKDAVILCQKCYFNFSVFRSTIDLMTEFCVDKIYYRGGSKKSRDFFNAYFNKIGLWKLQDQFYREFFRSGNPFIYRVEGKITPEDIKRLNQTFGETLDVSSTIPIRYTMLNPADIHAQGSISFSSMIYYKVLNSYELERLRNPRTPEDEAVLKSLAPEVRKEILSKTNGLVYIPLDNENIVAVFYKKQDYECFAVPMGFPVLADINFKREMRLLDQAVMRACQQIVLLITMGAEPEKGGINQNNLVKMQKLFENESAVRVIIADYTTEAKFVIPDVANILDPKKYEVLDRDIAIGLNNILLGEGEKFANQNAKIEIFVERLKHARQAFINEFLQPEIKRTAKRLGLKNYPEAYYEDIDLKNEIEYAKIYTRLLELGALTVDETIDAINNHRLPTPEDSENAQRKFKELKDKGLYEPLLNKPKEAEAGRPEGTKSPQSTKKISPIGASAGETFYSLVKIKDNFIKAQQIENKITETLKQKHNLKRLNKAQKEVVAQILDLIITNENVDDWDSKINQYIEDPVDKNRERVNEVLEIAERHQIETFLAGILLASVKIEQQGEVENAKE